MEWQAAKFKDEWIIGEIAQKSSLGEARKFAAEYATEENIRTDFFQNENNVNEMYRITLAKFVQNPQLGRWLVDTDKEGLMPQIFHTAETDSFWALGPLKEGKEGEADPGYTGKNLNGQVLMCVREELRKHYEETIPPYRPRIRSAADLDDCFVAYEKATDYLRSSFAEGSATHGAQDDPPLARGSLIDKRYRVLDHRMTAGLGAFTGQYGYICGDEMPLAEPLDARVRDLVQMSASAGLRSKLERLQEALCNENAPMVGMEWKEVKNQVCMMSM